MKHVIHSRCGRRFASLAAATFAVTLSGVAISDATETFVASPHNPVFYTGLPGAWDGDAAVIPHIVIEDGTWYMFYFGQADLTGAAAIGFSTSDDGVRWSRADCNPVMTGDGEGFDAIAVSSPTVRIRDGTWQMYYVGIGSLVFPPNMLQTGYATAPDACGPWTRLDAPVLTVGSAGTWDADAASVDSIVEGDGELVMYYTGSTNFLFTSAQVGMATSTDGITWTKYDNPATTSALYAESDPVVSPGSQPGWDEFATWFPDVVRNGAAWEMYYTGIDFNSNHAIGYATSGDGITWTKSPNNPVYTQLDDPVSAEFGYIIESPHVVDTDSARLLYYDYGRGPGEAIGFAISDADEDGVADIGDNCLLASNADQRDTDNDGFGNECDPDLNNDCNVNSTDLGAMKAVFFGSDPDADLDGDGAVNFIDLGIMKASFFLPPGPSGLPTLCDGG